MKKNILVITLAILGLIGIGFGGYLLSQKIKTEPVIKESDTSNWKTYQNYKSNFSITVPDTYQYRDLGPLSSFSVSEPGLTQKKGVAFVLGYVQVSTPTKFSFCPNDEGAYQKLYSSLARGNFVLINSPILGKQTKGILVFPNPADENDAWIKYNICHNLKEFTFDFQTFGYTREEIENNFKPNVIDKILSTFKFL